MAARRPRSLADASVRRRAQRDDERRLRVPRRRRLGHVQRPGASRPRRSRARTGSATARSLARLYAGLRLGRSTGPAADPPRRPGRRDAPCARPARSSRGCPTMAHRWGTGFQLASPPSQPMLGPASFGHAGAGGQLAFADVEHEVGFAYLEQPDGRRTVTRGPVSSTAALRSRARRLGQERSLRDARPAAFRRDPQLLTYPDSLGGNLRADRRAARRPARGPVSRGPRPAAVPVLWRPRLRAVDALSDRAPGSAAGRTWEHLAPAARRAPRPDRQPRLSARVPSSGPSSRTAGASPSANLFITLDKVWPDGDPPAVGRRAHLPAQAERAVLEHHASNRPAKRERVWTSFGSADWSEQIDLDVRSPATSELIRRLAGGLRRARGPHRAARRRGVRDQAAGDVRASWWSRRSTTSWAGSPRSRRTRAWSCCPRSTTAYATHERLSAHGFWTYDFVLPGLVLHAFETGETHRLASHLASAPSRQFTTLDCHDGIPIRPDLDGILEPHEMRHLADLVERRGGNVNRILSGAHADEVDVHRLNGTFRSSLGGDDDRYLVHGRSSCSRRGVPQVYYVGLLAASTTWPRSPSGREGGQPPRLHARGDRRGAWHDRSSCGCSS